MQKRECAGAEKRRTHGSRLADYAGFEKYIVVHPVTEELHRCGRMLIHDALGLKNPARMRTRASRGSLYKKRGDSKEYAAF